MKITGVAIIRNAVKNDYPVVEAINSILPMVDEMVVSIDRGEDSTDDLIKSIVSEKIRIVYSTWDMELREGGKVYAVETDKAIAHVSEGTDWIFYIQADEVIHEKYHATILEAAGRYQTNEKVQGLLFKYLHFYATYDYVGDSRKWYSHEVRLIKNDRRISSYKDAQGFRIGNQKLNVVPVDAEVYHYGWVKSPEQMMQKQKHIIRYYINDEKEMANYQAMPDTFDFTGFDSIKKFTGTHPSVMKNRIASRNWTIELDVNKKRLKWKDRLLLKIEAVTGKRLFSFENYKKIKWS